MPKFVPLKMFSFDNSFDSIHRSDKRAKQVELQQRPISLFKESFEQRGGGIFGQRQKGKLPFSSPFHRYH